MRLEYKYLVHNRYLDSLRRMLQPYVDLDQHVQDDREVQEYTVRSIYYDTSRMEYYHEKLAGIRTRKKLRIRGYNHYDKQNIVFLEIKRKYENYIGKNRSALKYHDLGELLKTGDIEEFALTENGFAKSIEDGERFLHHMNMKSLKPVVLVVYDREAFFSKFDSSLRITFDKNLRYMSFPKLGHLYNDSELRYALKDHFVFEIKFYAGFPSWLSQILTKLELSRKAVSKYTICLEAEKLLNPMKRKTMLPFIESFDSNGDNGMEDIF